MIIHSKNFSLKLEEILKVEISALIINETEKKVIKLIKQWINNDQLFHFPTSGSTGKPKIISVPRDKIIYSTNATFDALSKEKVLRTCLLCLDPTFIGGAMVVFRALIKELDLYIIEPTTRIADSLDDEFYFDLVSVVPMQYQAMTQLQINRFHTILIGGAPIQSGEVSHDQVYSTYGMTETVSHVALRKLNQDVFQTTGDTKVRLEEQGQLAFKGTITDQHWIKTTDMGDVISDTSFRWVGRLDHMINTGGIKVNPEAIEARLSDQIKGTFIISSIPDQKLGERVVLVMEQENTELVDFSILSKYEVPKQLFSGIKLPRTKSNKLDRIATKELIKSIV